MNFIYQRLKKYLLKKEYWIFLFTFLLTHTALSQTLYIYNWNNYLPNSVARQFEKLYHCKIAEDFYGENEEMLAKLTAGAKGYDIVIPTRFAAKILQKQNKLAPIDIRQLPNLKNIHKHYLKEDAFNRQKIFSIPYAFTITTLGYNITQLKRLKIDKKIDSWALIFEPAVLVKLKGKITVLDSQRELIAAALMYLKKNPASTDPADWLAASKVIIKAKPYWTAFNNQSYIKELAVGNIWVAMGYSSDFYQAKKYTKQIKQAIEIGYGLQKEGNILALDSFVILSHSKNKQLAHQFINFMLDGKNSAALTNKLGLGNPNKTAFSYIDTHMARNQTIRPDQKSLEKFYELSALPMSLKRQLNRIWSEIKLH